jgi:lipid A 3-O-deacylase
MRSLVGMFARLAVVAVAATCLFASPAAAARHEAHCSMAGLPSPSAMRVLASQSAHFEPAREEVTESADQGQPRMGAGPAPDAREQGPHARTYEVRFGIAANNVLDDEHKDEGANISAELVFPSPAPLRAIGHPRPFVMVSAHTNGGANFVGVGLAWRWQLGPNWAVEPAFAYVLHDGEIDAPANAPAPSEHILYGSRDLFRSSIAVERRISDRAAVQLFAAHYSNGQILGGSRNQGSEEIGVRCAWRFNWRR